MTSTIPGTTAPDITVTMAEDATTFEGLVTVQRHDHPSPSEVAAYLRSVLGPAPVGVHVHVIGADEDFVPIDQALTGSGIELSHDNPESGSGQASESGGKHALQHPAEDSWWEGEGIDVARPTEDAMPAWRACLRTNSWPVLAVIAAVVLCGVAIWVTLRALGPDKAQTPAAADTHSASTQPTVSPTDAVAQETVPSTPTPPGMVVSRGGLMVEVPAGFSVEVDGDMWRATGKDPDFRLQLAVDPLYGLASQDLLAEVLREIEADPAVELVSNDDSGATYREHAADGSQTVWRTWVEGDHQLSVGCHTRSNPTTVHNATCAKAMDSARFDAEEAPA